TFMLVPLASGQTWTGTANDEKWSTAGNWNPGPPGVGGNVFVSNEAHPVIRLDVDATIGSLTMSGYALIFDDDRLGSTARNLFVQGTTTITVTNHYSTGLDATSGANFRLGTLSNFANGVLADCYLSVYDNDGTASNLPTRIQFRGADVITNNAFVFLEGADAAIVDQDTGLNAFRHLAANTNQFYVGSQLTMSFPGNFANTGDLYVYDETAAPTGSLTINGTITNSGENGYVYVNEGGNLHVTGDFNNSGDDFNGGLFVTGDHPDANFPATVTIDGNLNNAVDSYIFVNGKTAPARLIVKGSMTNNGDVSLRGIGSLEVAGVVTLGSGFFTMQDSATGFETFKMTAARIDLAAGSAFGARGTLFCDLVDNGIFRPGASPGRVTVNGSITMGSTAELQIELGGTTAGTQYDQIVQHNVSSDSVTLGGKLAISFVGGFESTIQNSDSFTILTSDLALSGAFSNVANGGRVQVTNGSGSLVVTSVGNNVVLSSFLPTPLSLTGAVSRKLHGGTTTIDLPLSLDAPATVEPRRGAVATDHLLVFTFSNAIVSGSASVTNGTGNVSGTPSISGNTMSVALSGVSDEQKITVTLSNVTDTLGQVLPTAAVSVRLLVGDVNRDGIVNSGDATQTRTRSGQPVSTANFGADVNTDGTINGGDALIVRGRSGKIVAP
ncbi:MAG TPA: dockerin type I domain-containing protein, partial [Chthoniobacterales bacterium]